MMTDPSIRNQWQQLTQNTAEAYERHLVPLLFAPGAQFLTTLAGVDIGERVLDVGCATGSVARHVAPQVGIEGNVVGLDLNANMPNVARRISADMIPTIEWRQADVYEIPYGESSFDVIFCQQALQFFPDLINALREMYRVLAPNGRLVLSVLRPIEHNPGWALFAKVLESRLGTDAGALMASPFPDLNMDQLRDLIARAGFRNSRISLGISPIRYPSARAFLHSEMESWLLAERFVTFHDDIREALINDLA